MGFRRSSRYLMLRLLRIKDTTHKIALGLSMGVAISFIPVPGTHIIQAALFTWLLRGNVLASFIGTLAGNPLTLPLMWLAAYKIGAWFYAVMGLPIDQMPDHFTTAHLMAELRSPWGLLLPWVLGGYILMLVSLVLGYVGFYWLVAKARHQRVVWKTYQVHNEALDITEKQA